MGGSQDCVLPAPQVASAGPLTAVRGLPALGVWGGAAGHAAREPQMEVPESWNGV